MGGQAQLSGPDLEKEGVATSQIAEGGMTQGHAQGESLLVARVSGRLYAIGATCTHYGGPLAEGRVVDGGVHCPWHHACFDLKTGRAEGAPALNPVACWKVEERDGRAFVTGKDATPPAKPTPKKNPKSVVIIGAGAAGHCAAERLRELGYDGPVTLVGADPSVPVDRPNLSKDYLAGTAPEEWMPLRSAEDYASRKIDLLLGVRATAIDTKAKTVTLDGGRTLSFDALIVATGADPVRLQLPGADLPHVHTLRTIADSRAIIARATTAKRAVVIGASFIGLEVAGALRTRGLEVDVVAPEEQPLVHVLGRDVGVFVRGLHEAKGVRFHLGDKPASIAATEVTLASGKKLAADLVVMGVGVRPNVGLAEAAGLATDRGVVVDAYLETSVPGIFAVGDVARYPDPATGARIRVEHWVAAQRQGQAAAANVLGERRAFTTPPFFWSQHYDTGILYVGHAEKPDAITVKGDLAGKDCIVAYREGGKVRAVVTIGRDAASLAAEEAFARGDDAALDALVAS